MWDCGTESAVRIWLGSTGASHPGRKRVRSNGELLTLAAGDGCNSVDPPRHGLIALLVALIYGFAIVTWWVFLEGQPLLGHGSSQRWYLAL
jgi:hypothetical protein